MPRRVKFSVLKTNVDENHQMGSEYFVTYHSSSWKCNLKLSYAKNKKEEETGVVSAAQVRDPSKL